jgi:hypothetical protein
VDPSRGHYDDHDAMVNRTFTADDLTALLERLRLQEASAKSTAEVTAAQLDITLARIAALTEALRNADDGEASRLASRLLLGDLATVAAHFRARTNDIAVSLSPVLQDTSL